MRKIVQIDFAGLDQRIVALHLPVARYVALFPAEAGPLVGTRTWGGLVGIGGYPVLMDGGMVTAPCWAIYGTQGQWEVENIGIPPDVKVEQDPAQQRLGHDPQLEAGVRIALEALAKIPQPIFAPPAAPDRKPVLPDSVG